MEAKFGLKRTNISKFQEAKMKSFKAVEWCIT